MTDRKRPCIRVKTETEDCRKNNICRKKEEYGSDEHMDGLHDTILTIVHLDVNLSRTDDRQDCCNRVAQINRGKKIQFKLYTCLIQRIGTPTVVRRSISAPIIHIAEIADSCRADQSR